MPYLDEYVEQGESAVLVDDQVYVLSPLATTVLAAIGDGQVEVADIAAVLGEVHGAPPGGDLVLATAEAVRTLAVQGLVEIVGTAGDSKN